MGVYGRWEGWRHWGGEKILFRALVFTCHFLRATSDRELQLFFFFCPCFISFLKGNPSPPITWAPRRVLLLAHTHSARPRDPSSPGGIVIPEQRMLCLPVHQTALPGQGYHQFINLMCIKPGKGAGCCGQAGCRVCLSSGAVATSRKFVSLELDSGRTRGVCAAAGSRQRPLAWPWVCQGRRSLRASDAANSGHRSTIKKLRNNLMCLPGRKPEGGNHSYF